MSNWKDWPSQSPEARAKRRATNREHLAAKQREWAAAHPDYQKNWDKENAAYHKAWWDAHPEKKKERNRKASAKRQAEQPEAIAAYRAEWLERPGVREKRRVYESKRDKQIRSEAAVERAKIPPSPLLMDEAHVKAREWQRAYRERNREAYQAIKLASANKRRAAMKAGGSFTPGEWRAVCAQQNGLCFDCGERRRLTVGHLVPLSKGGPNVITNIVAQCMPCNLKQHGSIHQSASG